MNNKECKCDPENIKEIKLKTKEIINVINNIIKQCDCDIYCSDILDLQKVVNSMFCNIGYQQKKYNRLRSTQVINIKYIE